MQVVRHPIYSQGLLFFLCDYSGNVFIQFFFKILQDQVVSAFHGKNDLNINLRIGSRHKNLFDVYDINVAPSGLRRKRFKLLY